MKKVENNRVAELREHPASESAVREEGGKRREGCWKWLLDKDEERVAKDIKHPGINAVAPERFENVHCVRDHERLLFRTRRVKNIDRERPRLVLRVEHDHVFAAGFRDVVREESGDGLAVGIDHRDAVSCGNICGRYRGDEMAFPGSRGATDAQMFSPGIPGRARPGSPRGKGQGSGR
jgi:hypothetical protein